MGIKELRDKKLISPIQISAIEKRGVSQQELNMIRQEDCTIPGLSEEEIDKVRKWDYLKFIVELFITFTTVSAAFAFSGIGLTDGYPPVVYLPSEIIPISFFDVIRRVCKNKIDAHIIKRFQPIK